MTKRIFLPLLIVAMSALAPAVVASEEANLLANGSFERFAVSGLPDSWTRVSGGASASERSGTRAKAGNYSLKVTDASSTVSVGVQSELIAVSEGATYELSAFVYLEQSANQPSIYVRYYDAEMVQIYNRSTSGGTQTGVWNHISDEHRAPLGARYARLLCYSTIASEGTMYFDGISFRRSESRLVVNPDMSLDELGHHPYGWERNSCLSERGAVAADPKNAANRVLKLVDNSPTAPAAYYTTIPVTANMTYEAAADVLREAGSTPSLFVKYYDAADAEIASDNVATTTSGAWQRLTLKTRAPEGAVSARVMAYIAIGGTGVAYFDNIAFKPVYQTRYVAPQALGAGSGTSAADAALFSNATFWNGVKTLLQSGSVKVVFLEGRYIINDNDSRLLLENIGTDNHVLVMEGEKPFATVFARGAQATVDRLNMVALRFAKNAVLRHLHWEDDAPNSKIATGYSLVVQSTPTGRETKNITIEGCSFVGLWRNYYGAFGAHYAQTSNVTLRRSEFVGGGSGTHFHMVYHSYGPKKLRTLDNYFQDAAGAYVRHRAGCTDVLVQNNRFVSTARAYNQPFLEQAVFNDVNPGDEVLGHTFLYSGNTFVYQVSGASLANIAIRVYASGFDPYVDGVSWNYLLTSAQGTTLRSGTLAQKKAILLTHFGLDFDTNIILQNNVRQGVHERKAILYTLSNYGAVNKGGDGNYDISSLVGD